MVTVLIVVSLDTRNDNAEIPTATSNHMLQEEVSKVVIVIDQELKTRREEVQTMTCTMKEYQEKEMNLNEEKEEQEMTRNQVQENKWLTE